MDERQEQFYDATGRYLSIYLSVSLRCDSPRPDLQDCALGQFRFMLQTKAEFLRRRRSPLKILSGKPKAAKKACTPPNAWCAVKVTRQMKLCKLGISPPNKLSLNQVRFRSPNGKTSEKRNSKGNIYIW